MATEDILIEVSSKRHTKTAALLHHLSGTASALVMIAAAIVALILTNVGFHEPLHAAMMTQVGFYVGDTFIGMSFEQLVNDLLMAFFFLLVGCELKYEMTVGALAKPKQAILPMVAALGGVCGPAIIFLCINLGGDGVHGWAIPTATDIAFALAVMSLFGDRMPVGGKVFFSTLAIADDMVAIIVIALFYSTEISLMWLGLAVVVTVALLALNRLQVYKLTPYLLLGCVLWLCFFNSGIHATLAGVVLAFTLPVKTNVKLQSFAKWIGSKSREFDQTYDSDMRVLGQHEVTEVARQIERVSHGVTPPLQRLEHSLNMFVNFLILPLFAFVNAQVYIAGADLGSVLTAPVTLGVFFGLLLGKPIGILLTTFVLVKFAHFSLPKNTTWGHMVGIGVLGGIGFTMAILVAGLAYSDETHIMNAKVGILLGTFTAAIVGLVYLFIYIRAYERKTGMHGDAAAQGSAGVQVRVGVDENGDGKVEDDELSTMEADDASSEQLTEAVSQAVSALMRQAISQSLREGDRPVKMSVSIETEGGERRVVSLDDQGQVVPVVVSPAGQGSSEARRG